MKVRPDKVRALSEDSKVNPFRATPNSPVTPNRFESRSKREPEHSPVEPALARHDRTDLSREVRGGETGDGPGIVLGNVFDGFSDVLDNILSAFGFGEKSAEPKSSDPTATETNVDQTTETQGSGDRFESSTPAVIPQTLWANTVLGPAYDSGSGQLDLNKVTPEMIAELTPEQRRQLADQLKGQEIDYRNFLENGDQAHGELSADLLLSLILNQQEGGDKAAAQMFAANPRMLDDFLRSGGQPMIPGGSADLVKAISKNLDAVVSDMRATNNDGSPWENAELEGLGTLMALDMEAGQYHYDEGGYLRRDDPDFEQSRAIAERYLQALDPKDNAETGAFSGVMLNGLFKFFDRTGVRGKDQGTFFNLLASGAAIVSPVASFLVTAASSIAGTDGRGAENPTQFLSQIKTQLLRSWEVDPNLTSDQRQERQTWLEIGLGEYAFGYE